MIKKFGTCLEIRTYACCTGTLDEMTSIGKGAHHIFSMQCFTFKSPVRYNGTVATCHRLLSYLAVMKVMYRIDLGIRTHAYCASPSDGERFYVISACIFVSLVHFTQVSQLRQNGTVKIDRQLLSSCSIQNEVPERSGDQNEHFTLTPWSGRIRPLF